MPILEWNTRDVSQVRYLRAYENDNVMDMKYAEPVLNTIGSEIRFRPENGNIPPEIDEMIGRIVDSGYPIFSVDYRHLSDLDFLSNINDPLMSSEAIDIQVYNSSSKCPPGAKLSHGICVSFRDADILCPEEADLVNNDGIVKCISYVEDSVIITCPSEEYTYENVNGKLVCQKKSKESVSRCLPGSLMQDNKCLSYAFVGYICPGPYKLVNDFCVRQKKVNCQNTGPKRNWPSISVSLNRSTARKKLYDPLYIEALQFPELIQGTYGDDPPPEFVKLLKPSIRERMALLSEEMNENILNPGLQILDSPRVHMAKSEYEKLNDLYDKIDTMFEGKQETYKLQNTSREYCEYELVVVPKVREMILEVKPQSVIEIVTREASPSFKCPDGLEVYKNDDTVKCVFNNTTEARFQCSDDEQLRDKICIKIQQPRN